MHFFESKANKYCDPLDNPAASRLLCNTPSRRLRVAVRSPGRVVSDAQVPSPITTTGDRSLEGVACRTHHIPDKVAANHLPPLSPG